MPRTWHALGRVSKQGTELAKARADLGRDSLKGAVRHGWAAGTAAAQANDGKHLEAVMDVAAAAREQASGSLQREAESLFVYCSSALADVRAGTPRRSQLERLLASGRGRTSKICPDCAERVQAAARICRFCGHRFDES